MASSPTWPGAESRQPAAGSQGGARQPRLRDRLIAILFGQDIFISYAREDSVLYAEALANRLAAQDFAVFIDQYGTPPGKEVPPAVLKALRRSKMLVCVSSRAAARSEAVKLEIDTFRRAGRPVIPIDIDRAIETGAWFPLIEGLARTPETEGALQSGTPSNQVVNRVKNAFEFTRRNQRVRRAFVLAFALLIAATAAGAYYARVARESADLAPRGAIEANTEREFAEHKTREAEEQRVAASMSAPQAREQEAIARQRALEARQRQVIAERNADIARARELSADAERYLGDPVRTQDGLEAAIGAGQLLQARAARADEVDAALRHAIALSPARVRPSLSICQRPLRLALSQDGDSMHALCLESDNLLTLERVRLAGDGGRPPAARIQGTFRPLGADARYILVETRENVQIWDLGAGQTQRLKVVQISWRSILVEPLLPLRWRTRVLWWTSDRVASSVCCRTRSRNVPIGGMRPAQVTRRTERRSPSAISSPSTASGISVL